MKTQASGVVVTADDLANLTSMAWDAAEALCELAPDSDAHESARCVAKWLEAMATAVARRASAQCAGQLRLPLG